MASNNPSSFRLPIQLPKDVHPAVRDALAIHDDAITDLQQAIPYLKISISSATSSTSTTGTTSGGSTETVVLGTTSSVGTVSNQTGLTSYSTQQSDYGAIIVLSDASAIAVTLTTGTAIQTPWFASILNLGAGTATVTPATGTVNGGGSITLATGQWAFVYYDSTNFWADIYAPSGGGGGSVTSVALTVPSRQTVTGSPITTAGTLAITDNTESANQGFFGPASGGAATPTFRALVPADLPVATSSAFGAVKPDNSTVTISGGVLSAPGGGGGTITGVTAGTGLTGGGTSGTVTLALITPVTVADGGTGTASPSLVAGSGISITGSFPNQTVTATGGGGGYSLGGAVTTANVSLGSGAGSGASIASVAGLDGTHVVIITLGSSPTYANPIYTLTFSTSRGHITYPVANAFPSIAGSTPSIVPFCTGSSATSYSLWSATTPTAGASYNFVVSAP